MIFIEKAALTRAKVNQMGNAVIAIHGGAGAITRAQLSQEQERRYIEALSSIVETGQRMLEAGIARGLQPRMHARAVCMSVLVSPR